MITLHHIPHPVNPVQVESPQNFDGQQSVSQNLSISAILIGQNVPDVTEKGFIPAILSVCVRTFCQCSLLRPRKYGGLKNLPRQRRFFSTNQKDLRRLEGKNFVPFLGGKVGSCTSCEVLDFLRTANN